MNAARRHPLVLVCAVVVCLAALLAASSGFAGEEPNQRPEGTTLPAEPPTVTPDNPPVGGPEGVPGGWGPVDWFRITHGVCTGDVTSGSAVIWARCSHSGEMHVLCDTDPGFSHPLRESRPAPAIEAEDYTASVKLAGLQPATLYHYRVWFTSGMEQNPPVSSKPEEGRFKTAPDSTRQVPVSLVWSGGLGGEDYCRRAGKGYEILKEIAAAQPDFFLALGNMIYADGSCDTGGPRGDLVWENVPGPVAVTDPAVSWDDAARVRDIFWQHWRYNRDDSHMRKLLASTSMYSVWDAHEVLQGFGAPWDYWNDASRARPGYRDLVLEGLDAFLQYAPIDRSPAEVNRIYRSFRWGKDCELFLLDTRSYRSRNELADRPENHKTMLGTDQLEWLRHGLLGSSATWKVVACPSPLSIPIGREDLGRDGWASGSEPDSTGFERELLELLGSLQAGKVSNLVFLTSGAGWAAEIRYEKDLTGAGRPLVFHELVAGPLSARRDEPVALDPTLHPTLLYGEGGLFSFGRVSIETRPDGKAHLLAEICGEDGKVRHGSGLDLAPAPLEPAGP